MRLASARVKFPIGSLPFSCAVRVVVRCHLLQRLAAASSALLRALSRRFSDVIYSDIADQASAPVNSRIHSRFSAVVSVLVAVTWHSSASGVANISIADVAKSAVFGVSKPRRNVSTSPARPRRLSAPEIAVTQRGTADGCGKDAFI
jgi:hypothetical protein